jgi:hypothetical protein
MNATIARQLKELAALDEQVDREINGYRNAIDAFLKAWDRWGELSKSRVVPPAMVAMRIARLRQTLERPD